VFHIDSHNKQLLLSWTTLTGSSSQWRCNVSCEVRTHCILRVLTWILIESRRLPEPSNHKIRAWAPSDAEARITVMARASRKLPVSQASNVDSASLDRGKEAPNSLKRHDISLVREQLWCSHDRQFPTFVVQFYSPTVYYVSWRNFHGGKGGRRMRLTT
jgi:hypothetical protein